MELKIDLLERDTKSHFRIVLGIIFFAMSCTYITKIIHEEFIRPPDWVCFGVFLLCGIGHVLEGLGFSANRLFGKAYLVIKSECVLLKAGAFKKEQSIDWDNIKSINYNRISEELRIEKTDNTNVIVDFYKLGYSFNNEIKETLNCIAKEKEIQFVF